MKERAKQLKRDIPAVFMALKDRDTPILAKVLAWFTVAYALSPIDLIPDVVPVLGYLDDLLILPALVTITLKLIPKDVMERCRVRAEALEKDDETGKWYYSIPILLVWVLLVYVIVKALC